jgi:endonuclease/exonuclease/phosphatase family metal-dependent hydrolase
MRRRSPLSLVPLAFLTLACGQPVGGLPPVPPSAPTAQAAPATKAIGAAERRAAWAARDKGAVQYGRQEPLPKARGAARLAVYNVENLFDDHDDPTLSGKFEDAGMTTSPERLLALAATIEALDADVLALTEIESEAALRWFRDRYLVGLGYEHLASVDAGDPRGIEQAVLSRWPIVEVENWPQARIDDMVAKREGTGWATPVEGRWPSSWARSPLLATVQPPHGEPITLVVVHHKSGRTFDAQRELEALKTLEIVQARLAARPEARLAILGDFNATPGAKSVKVYLDTERPRLRNAYDKRFQRNAPADTYTTHASGRPIDYIIMSPALFRMAKDESFFVLGTPIAPSRDAPKPKGYASDHFPVAIDLSLGR